LLIFLFSFFFRLYLSTKTNHVDIYTNAAWGEWIGENGPKGFYENNIWVYSWPTQPPLVNLVYGASNDLYKFFLELLRDSANTIVKYHLAPGHMVWWFNFVIWFDNPLTTEIWFPVGYLSTIKLFPILADLGIAFLIFYVAKISKSKNLLLWPSVYLFSPFSFYLSSLWGQYDQVSFLFLLASFLLLYKKQFLLSPLALSFSLGLKPTSLIFLPFYLFLYLKIKQKPLQFVLGILLALLLQYLTVKVFTDEKVIPYFTERLVPIVFYK
jgi:hypothetical protein